MGREGEVRGKRGGDKREEGKVSETRGGVNWKRGR